ncbi:MAG: manganese transporter [Gemmataceae bacterium]|nr:manganese transporter [Gemmataceae bacterium]
MMWHRLLAVVLLLPLFTGVGCQRETTGKHPTGGKPIVVSRTYQGSRPIKVTCTIGMVADIVRNIGDDLVKIEQMLGEGSDPHTHIVTNADLIMLDNADIIFYSGLHLEGKMTDTLERLASKKPTFAVTEYLDAKQLLRDEHDHPDPHVWFDVELWSDVARITGEVLALYDPTNADTYKKNTAAYRAELSKLHEETKTQIATIPPDQRVLITSHDAFRYFGRAYKIEVKGVQGISTVTEASLREVNQLVDYIVARKVKAIFAESSVNQQNMESLRQGCKSRGRDVALGGELFSDAMGKTGEPEGTYVGMIRHNVDTIVKALR